MDGERLAELRQGKQLKQQELADILGVSKNSLSKYERNLNEPDDETKKKIAEYFNVSLDYLLGLTREQIPIRTTGAVCLYFSDLPQAARDELTGFLDYLRKRYHL